MRVVAQRGWMGCVEIGGRDVVAKLYEAWMNMRRRCASNHPNFYRWYRAQGITVCAEWDDYAVFRAWAIANGFRKGMSLDRIDNAAGYSPLNCRWVPWEEQQVNKRNVRWLTFRGVTKPLSGWAKHLGLKLELLRGRAAKGWTDEEILTQPVGECRPGQRRGRRPRAN